MKTWLAGAFLLMICSGAVAQSSSDVCRLKIGEDWIPMGASVFRSCLKYAESAATPGERQYAEFGGISFYFIDGKFAQSRDGGKTWQPFRLDDNQAQIGSLNVLRESPQAEEETPRKRERAKSKPAEPITTEIAAEVERPSVVAETPVAEPPSAVAIAEPAPPIRRVPRAAPSPAAGETVQPAPQPGLRAPSRRAPVAAATTVPLKDCQINTGKSWQNVVTPSLAACGQLLTERMKNYPTTRGHAYWGTQYLLSYGGLLYLSADGQNWSRMQ